MKYSNPLWQTNPVLAQIREALSEVERIRTVLKEFETKAAAFPAMQRAMAGLPEGSMQSEAVVLALSVPDLIRLDGWSKSLTESEIGLWTMVAPQVVNRFVQERKQFIDQQVLKWGAIMAGKGAVRIGTQIANFLGLR